MPGGLDPHSHVRFPQFQIAIKLLRFSSAVVQLPFAALPGVFVCKCDLLKARVIIHSYNDHIRLLPPEPWFGWHHQVYSGRGSRHCYEIIWIAVTGTWAVTPLIQALSGM